MTLYACVTKEQDALIGRGKEPTREKGWGKSRVAMYFLP